MITGLCCQAFDRHVQAASIVLNCLHAELPVLGSTALDHGEQRSAGKVRYPEMFWGTRAGKALGQSLPFCAVACGKAQTDAESKSLILLRPSDQAETA